MVAPEFRKNSWYLSAHLTDASNGCTAQSFVRVVQRLISLRRIGCGVIAVAGVANVIWLDEPRPIWTPRMRGSFSSRSPPRSSRFAVTPPPTSRPSPACRPSAMRRARQGSSTFGLSFPTRDRSAVRDQQQLHPHAAIPVGREMPGTSIDGPRTCRGRDRAAPTGPPAGVLGLLPASRRSGEGIQRGSEPGVGRTPGSVRAQP